MITICAACRFTVPGPEQGKDISAAEVEALRVWHFHDEHPEAWRYLMVTLGSGRGSDRPAPLPSKRYQPRPRRLELARAGAIAS